MSLVTAIGMIPDALREPLAELVIDIIQSNNPLDALGRARRALIADAADAATDAVLEEVLKGSHKQ